MKRLPITLILCYVVLIVLGIGAAWDCTLSLFLGLPTWCSYLRQWNTVSNDLLASCMASTIGFLLFRWAWGPKWYNPMGPVITADRDSRILFCAFAFLALFMHLFLIYWLHLAHIEAIR